MYDFLAPGSALPGDLKWETTEQFDLRLGLGLWQDRIVFGADYYLKTTDDLLNAIGLPSSFGFTRTTGNVGSIANKRMELSLYTQISHLISDGFQIETSLLIITKPLI